MATFKKTSDVSPKVKPGILIHMTFEEASFLKSVMGYIDQKPHYALEWWGDLHKVGVESGDDCLYAGGEDIFVSDDYHNPYSDYDDEDNS